MNNFNSDNFNDGENGNKNRLYQIKTITLGPRELWLLVISFILFVASATCPLPIAIAALIVVPPVYAAFSYRIGNNFSLLVPIVAFLLSLIITRDISYALFVPLAGAMSFSILRASNSKEKGAKTAAVAGCTISAAAFLLLELVIAIKIKESFTSKELFNAINLYFNTAAEAFSNSVLEYSGIISSTLPAAKAELFEPSAIKKSVAAVFFMTKMTLPAIITVYCMITGYISASLLGPVSRICGAREMLADTDYTIKLSRIAIVVYFVTSIGGLFASGAAYFGLRNITYILSPALMLCGIKQIGEFFSAKGLSKGARIALQILLTAIAFTAGNLGTTILMLMGIYYTSKNAFPAP